MTTGLLITRPKKSVITLVWWSIANDYQAQRVLCMEQKIFLLMRVPLLERCLI